MAMITSFGSPLADLELWRCAQQQIDQHGHMEAVIEATRRMYAMGEAGDRDGANTWMAITLRGLHLAPSGSAADGIAG